MTAWPGTWRSISISEQRHRHEGKAFSKLTRKVRGVAGSENEVRSEHAQASLRSLTLFIWHLVAFQTLCRACWEYPQRFSDFIGGEKLPAEVTMTQGRTR